MVSIGFTAFVTAIFTVAVIKAVKKVIDSYTGVTAWNLGHNQVVVAKTIIDSSKSVIALNSDIAGCITTAAGMATSINEVIISNTSSWSWGFLGYPDWSSMVIVIDILH